MSTSTEPARIVINLDGGRPEDALRHVLLRARDQWVRAILMDVDGECYSPGGLALENVIQGAIFQTEDLALVNRLFGTVVPMMTVSRSGNELTLEGIAGGQEVVQHVASRPFWAHKTSRPLEALQ